ncbi:MAG: RelA/SpoT family protein [Curvibacter sp.]
MSNVLSAPAPTAAGGPPEPAGPAAANAAAASFASLTARLDYLSPSDLEQVRQAYRFADEAHLGQLRNSGEPYITHPIAVAAQCAEWKLDAQALMAALMHDALEDCGISKSELIERFGSPVAELVDGLTKLDKLQFDTREESQAESFRKMLLAMARDVRVILIKLADRSHNMRTLADVPRSKWARIASETLEIYAPIAYRLGLNQTYRELQELSFQHLRPWRHAVLIKALERARSRRRDLIGKVQREVETAFQGTGMPVRIAGREKTLYSIYRKMDEKHLSFAQITDMYGFRIIVPALADCYTALGTLHQLYKPVPGRFKDHIAIPKVNGYQSLHTTLVGPSGVSVEFQIRTEAMHIVAESGVAAHWLYKANEPDSPMTARLGAQWLQSLLDIQNETRDAAEFWDHVKVDLFPEAVYVFTPKSKIISMPRGATVVDFAYAIHSDIGDRTMAARINGEQVPLRTELKNGDVVEVVTSTVSAPNPAWLSFVRTGRARSKIRHHLKTLAHAESEGLGEKLLLQALRAEGIERFPADDDNVIPVLDGDWFADDITQRFRQFLRVAFGETHYDDNLAFIEQALNVKGKRNYSLRDYFLSDFYADHVKRYKKRPIYWLLSSPKGSFNALIYMHRYRPDTVSVVLRYLRDFRKKVADEKDRQASASINPAVSQGDRTRALKEMDRLNKVLAELDDYESDVIYPLATQQIDIDLDDGVKVNYLKFGAALKKIVGLEAKDED